MDINRTKVVQDQIVDAETGLAIAKTFGSAKRAMIISEIINAYVDKVNEEAHPSNKSKVDSRPDLRIEGTTTEPEV